MSENTIKCKNCGATRSSMTNFNVLIICPYCFEPIRNPTSGNIIKDLIFEGDEDILVNSMLLPLIVSLIDTKQQRLLKLIRIAINKDIPKKLYNLRYESEKVQTSAINIITGELITETGIEVEDAKEIVSYFADALGYKIEITPENYKQNNTYSAQSLLINNFDSSKIRICGTITFGDVEWWVIDMKNDSVLLLSKYVLQRHPYHSRCSNITWERSPMRKYVNGVFFKRFTTEEQSKIIETLNINSDNLWYGTNGGRDTKDKLFLLSLDEVDKYFGDSSDYKNGIRKCYNNREFIIDSNGAYFSNTYDNKRVALNINKEACEWWLRSPGGKNCPAASVGNDGSVHVKGSNFDDEYTGCGVRPALWLKL